VVEGSRRNYQVRLRIRVARSSAFIHEYSPSQHHVFGDRQYALLEHGPDLTRDPRVQFIAVIAFGQPAPSVQA
jgi:hypothetical protein